MGSLSFKRALFFLLLGGAVIQGGRIVWSQTHSLIHGALIPEPLTASIPEHLDQESGEWRTLSYGFHLAPWPILFRGEPFVTTLTYDRGPPAKFISEMIQVWSPGSAELVIEGPRTPVPGMGALEWKSCLGSPFCVSNKNRFVDSLLRDLAGERDRLKTMSWFEADSLQGARGLHLEFTAGDHRIDRYVVITNAGSAQNFTLKTDLKEAGAEARKVFETILRGMTLNDSIDASRDWISSRMKGVDLNRIQSIPDPKARYLRLFEVQNLLCSQLAIDPRFVAPYFHLAGVSHLLGVSLLKEKKTHFRNQESWILQVQPLLSTLIQYVGDFPEGTEKQKGERGAALANMESLLQDYLLLKEKISK
ncbi:MAG: hypothetical protein EBX52_01125 [Proteobacteria bacterium]|nr:hypothetical protein [Pseudomonadota bacterium]